MRLTLDTNCIIDVEENRPNTPYVKALAVLHQTGRIIVGVPAIGASERQREGGYAKSFSEFEMKLKSIDLDSLELLMPIGYLGITFIDFCLLADHKDSLEYDIHKVLFPNIEFQWNDYSLIHGGPTDIADKKWRNAKCDVLAMWCHIRNKGDIFVTSDKNFHKKATQLKSLGSEIISFPKDAVGIVQNSLENAS